MSSWQDQRSYQGMPQVYFPRPTKVVRRLLIANAAVFALVFVLDFGQWPWFDQLRSHLALRPSDWRSPWVPVWQLLTYGFLHDIQAIGHILMNMLTLYFFGTMLEELIGGRRFLLTYLAAQIAGGILYLVAGLTSGVPTSAIGASGATLGIMVVMAVLRPRQTVFLMFIPVTLKVLAFVFLGITLFGWLSSLKGGGGDGVAHLIHLGGIAYGFAAARLGWIYKDPIEAIDRHRAVAAVEKAADDEARMDRLLEKIHHEGMAALSRAERDFLKRMSARK